MPPKDKRRNERVIECFMAMDEYTRARKLGLKEVAEMSAAGKNPYPAVLDDIIAERGSAGMLALGIM